MATASFRSEARHLYAGIFTISAATLLLELTLTRIFDVILWNNLAYLIVSSAIFGFGLAGLFVMIRPMTGVPSHTVLAAGCAAFALLVLLLIPVLGWLPFDVRAFPVAPLRQFVAFGALYLFVLAPFCASGVVVALVLTRHAEQVHRLYSWDLAGAGIGCLGIFVLPSVIGGEEILLVIGASGALAAAAFAPPRRWTRYAGLLAALGLAVLTVFLSNRIAFRSLTAGHSRPLEENRRTEFSRWDPIAKIDILSRSPDFTKEILYDVDAQRSLFFAFDGDFDALRSRYFEIVDGRNRYNTGKYVALAHWLKRHSLATTLIIGSAGGQEILAALAWGAAQVDAVEMVCTVINAGRTRYAAFIGHLFTDSRVTVTCDEGRSVLRQSSQQYDVIQMHSNYTHSSLANGSGGLEPVYLQTVEAYREYLSHLTRDGILQINQPAYPRMITTAAKAWSDLFPGEEFKRHLVLTSGVGRLSTLLVKRSEWTRADIAAIRYFLGPGLPDARSYTIIYAPGEPEADNVPAEFFEVPLRPRFRASLPYKVHPTTDDRPFFRDLRKETRRLQADKEGYLPPETVELLNASLRGFVPVERIHLYVLGGLSVLFATVVILVPLLVFRRQGLRRPETLPTLLYFASLGIGFILVELVVIYKAALLIGFPVYAMATVLFTLLVSAGIGSRVAARFAQFWRGRAGLVIVPVGLLGCLLLVVFPHLSDLTLGLGQWARIGLVAAFLVPVGVPLGMFFPLGIQALHARAPALIPWAWGINALMTVIGSLLSVVLSMAFGFDRTLLVAVAFYAVAAASFRILLWTGTAGQPEPATPMAVS